MADVQKRTSPGAVECPLCGAESWAPCLTSGGKRLGNRWHVMREVAALRKDAQRTRTGA